MLIRGLGGFHPFFGVDNQGLGPEGEQGGGFSHRNTSFFSLTILS